MFPDQCTIYIAAINNKVVCDRSNYWEHVFTFNMRPMIEVAKLEPYLHRIEYEQVNMNDKIVFRELNDDINVILWNFSGGNKWLSNQAHEYVHSWKAWLSAIWCSILSGRSMQRIYWCIHHIFWYYVQWRCQANNIYHTTRMVSNNLETDGIFSRKKWLSSRSLWWILRCISIQCIVRWLPTNWLEHRNYARR